MDEKELKELFEQLEAQGWEPRLCDTPVPYYDNPISCGVPTAIGDIVEDVTMMPREFLSALEEFTVKVMGDSMKDADIIEDDVVKVVTTKRFNDGDIVLTTIDGETLLKCFCSDEEGHPWLVPQNRKYKAIALSERQDIWIIGVVDKIIKQAPRVNYRDCISYIHDAKSERVETHEITQLQVSQTIRSLAPQIKVARHWYAVYRAMADLSVVKENDFETFCSMIRTEVPRHEHLPTVGEMQRLAIQSFRKPVALWRSNNAPVSGKRYAAYEKIALQTRQLLENRD